MRPRAGPPRSWGAICPSSPGGGRRLESLNVYFEELRVGDRFETDERTVTEADIDEFAALTGDRNPIHVDDEAAAAGPFGRRVAHGLLTLGLAGGLRWTLSGERVLAFYGFDRVRLTRPVFPGDAIRVRGEVVASEERDERAGVVTFADEVVNQHGQTVAVLTRRTLYERRSAR